MENNEEPVLQSVGRSIKVDDQELRATTAATSSPLPRPYSQGDQRFYISGNARVHLGDNYMHATNSTESELQQKLLTRLSFPQMRERREQISNAYPATYRWMLQPLAGDDHQWKCFRTWLDESLDNHGMYWIHGKPGSGKSTIMKFLDDNLTVRNHMALWANGQPVIKARYYFWNAGTMLQKSLEGLYRYVLVQILEQRPDMVDYVISVCQWIDTNNYSIEWSKSELRQVLFTVVQTLSINSKLLFMVDGLDECEGIDEEQEELIDVLTTLSRFDNIKVCFSSRPWNVFRDAFDQCPQLQLEDLTSTDIETYVVSRLQTSRRWRFFENTHRKEADNLITDIISRVQGVFLWACLVVRDMVKDLQDGDSLEQLQRKLHHIPEGLNDYFHRIMESIEPSHRREASIMLQLALHQEKQFVSVFSFSLVDTFFITERYENFVVRPGFNVNCLDLKDERALCFRIDSALRKLVSRCKGLLECIVDGEDKKFSDDIHTRFSLSDDNWQRKEHASSIHTTFGSYIDWLTRIFNITIELLHRSLRDFLLLPTTQAILHQYTGGQQFDARLYLSSTRLIQFMALTSLGYNGDLAVGLASHLLSALSVNRLSNDSAMMAGIIQNNMEQLAASFKAVNAWYINNSLQCWHEEQSNFLSLSIDFRLTSYVLNSMSPQSIRSKIGRPILDYILRPRFTYLLFKIGNRWPDLELLNAALACGSDPNECITSDGPSIWALYLCYLVDLFRGPANSGANDELQSYYLQALRALVKAGAEPIVPLRWLSSPKDPRMLEGKLNTDQDETQSNEPLLYSKWPPTPVIPLEYEVETEDDLFEVSKLVRCIHWHSSIDIEPLVLELQSKESRTLKSKAQHPDVT
ncbi:hypothetical protein H2198_000672 [Neophaeococcomyces mojaviensis]|uniref:Uncharacterized protein n=1 Tax=Neophaeococcomyces mojaviensis TaxID=3383035 RepID=A0ACC3AJK2_9EURO|nr:hypothetical protein H2198_000672 [Knufia sp. JES_112]